MSQPASNQNESSKLKQLLNGGVDDSIKARLPRGDGPQVRSPKPAAIPAASVPESEPRRWRYKFLPAFWTIASVMSFTVNIVLLIILLILLQMLGTIQLTADDQVSGLLGGLYTNFVKMDEANIKTNIHVEKEIPVQFTLNVSGPTNVTLSEDVTINGALVTVETGGLNIVNARARIVLPRDTVLPINIQNLVVPVDQKVLAVLDVPVDIPLDQTELHVPFTGLQQVVKPWYCLVEPNALINNVQVCSPLSTQP
ncbi:MAG: hypothetical protein L0287_30860 [Anaerolineae bacterium]|nr:hypothetical protein [Anaerolineae bacterium]MCI0608181.1 hypothetical protein [Anaerolineae bacterium]